MNWRKLNRVLHRDIGYFFFGMSIIYGISGIALNHIDDWDPSYHIRSEEIRVEPSLLYPGQTNTPGQTREGGLTTGLGLTKEDALTILKAVNVDSRYKNHYYPAGNLLKIFVDGGSVTLNRETGEGIIEIVSRRPVFYQVNFLHYNNPKFLWTWFADIYGVGLVIMAITGLWMIQGRKGFYGRGKWFVIVGIIIPVLFILLYL